MNRQAETYGWQLMYLGAFGALLVPNVSMALELAQLTRSEDEAIGAISVMRRAVEGDRVYPALEFLRKRREAESAAAVPESDRIDAAEYHHGADR